MNIIKYTKEDSKKRLGYKIYSYINKNINKIRINYYAIFLFLLIGIGFGYLRWGSMLVPTSMRVEYLKKELRACEEGVAGTSYDQLQRACYMKAFVDMVRHYGLPLTAATLRSYMGTPRGQHLAGQRCHAIAHEIGNVAARTGVPAHTVLTQCADMCNTYPGSVPFDGLDAGCLNGAAHTWVLLSHSDELPTEKCNDPKASQEAREGCFHGIGHGLFEKNQADVVAAIEQCKTLPNEDGQYQCAHAIFMEPHAVFRKNDVIQFCDNLPISMQDSCFEFSGFMAFNQSSDVVRALDTCKRAGTRTVDCAVRVGEALYSRRHDSMDINLCTDVFIGSAFRYCVAGFVRGSMYNVSDYYGQFAIAACRQMDRSYGEFCFGSIGKYMKEFYGAEQQKATCAAAGLPDHVRACEQGVLL